MRRRMMMWVLPVLVVTAATAEIARRQALPAHAVTAKTPPAIPVVAAFAEARDVPVYLMGIGAVQAFNRVVVKVRVDGQLDKVAFTEGQDFKAGDLLAEIDPRPFEAALALAKATKAKDEAQLANAKLDLQRSMSLVGRGYTSKQTFDTQKALVAQLEAAVQGDEANITSATVQLGYTRITAPISGRIGARLIDQGNIVRASDAEGLAVITQLKPISVIFTLPQDALEDVTAAMAAGALKAVAFKRDDVSMLGEGTLAFVDNQIDAATGSIRLKATFANDQLRLWPGQFVNVRLFLDVQRNVITVPSQVVQNGPNGPYAFIVKPDQTVEQRPIRVGRVGDGLAVIEQGLKVREQVIVDGQYRVTAGSHVDTRPAAKSAAAPKS